MSTLAEMNRRHLQTDIAVTPFFTGMSDLHLKMLSYWACRTHFNDRQVIFRQGETANRFYLIEAGRVELSAAGITGQRELLLDTIGPEDSVGWSWLFEPYECQFTARALTEVQAIFFYGTVLRYYCEKDLSLGFELFKRMGKVMIKRLQSARRRALEAQSTHRHFSPVGGGHAMYSVR
jgi:CRP/FNR family cyclic AMP-dependent transcriptional regulator